MWAARSGSTPNTSAWRSSSATRAAAPKAATAAPASTPTTTPAGSTVERRTSRTASASAPGTTAGLTTAATRQPPPRPGGSRSTAANSPGLLIHPANQNLRPHRKDPSAPRPQDGVLPTGAQTGAREDDDTNQALGYSPTDPSIDSRMRSAWPLWRAY